MHEAMAWQRAEGLRGDFSDVDADWTVRQGWSSYTRGHHDLWRQLCDRQFELVKDYAASEFLSALEIFDLGAEIPRFEAASEILRNRTGWEIVGVPGLLPAENFFRHLAARRFPVTTWMRNREEFDYIVEPDLFHDFFGHVPLLVHQPYADFMELYGRRGLEAVELDGLEMLSRLYWYTIEFGLLRGEGGLRVYGAGILSSPGETRFAIDDPRPHRVDFDILRCLRTDYKIDEYQKTYFVIDSYSQIFEELETVNLAAVYNAWNDRPGLDPAHITPLFG